MEVKFDVVRIGNKRKNPTSELILKQNANLLKNTIRHVLKEEVCGHKNNREDITMIIPSRGHNVTFRIQDVTDSHIKDILKHRFPNSIYKGSLDTILDNINNRVVTFGYYR